MKIVNLVLCILNALCLAFNIYIQNYLVAAINVLAILTTASADLICD